MKRFLAMILVGLMLLAALPAFADGDHTVSWNGGTVEVRAVGAWESVVKTDGSETTVPSDELTWESETEIRYAYIWAPKTGNANLRLGPRSKASVIAKAETGRMVLVFMKGKQMSGILYNGTVGYMSNSTLKFVKTDTVPKATATLSYKGKADAKTNVIMRTGAAQGSRAVAKLQPGLPVVIFKLGKNWSEVECNGWHGYVMTQHLTEIEEIGKEEAKEETEPSGPVEEDDSAESVELD